MDAGLTLWGLYIPVDVLLTSIALYVVVSITLIILVPVYAVPIDRAVGEDGRLIPIPPEDLGKIIEMRSKVRSAVLQTLGASPSSVPSSRASRHPRDRRRVQSEKGRALRLGPRGLRTSRRIRRQQRLDI
ncbi:MULTISPECIES: hypothetical protein [Bradyrhizobium]|uniref:hypothetical protein n=1 Tax=Bradyrhizobium TaxID=374 RepID=UPI0004806E01|nr:MULTISPECIES: hypothetical protein [Bradyrhizobium]UFW51521.1 hypothetical protein BaraCB756_11340 [Bradyrhizobium arachidis]